MPVRIDVPLEDLITYFDGNLKQNLKNCLLIDSVCLERNEKLLKEIKRLKDNEIKSKVMSVFFTMYDFKNGRAYKRQLLIILSILNDLSPRDLSYLFYDNLNKNSENFIKFIKALTQTNPYFSFKRSGLFFNIAQLFINSHKKFNLKEEDIIKNFFSKVFKLILRKIKSDPNSITLKDLDKILHIYMYNKNIILDLNAIKTIQEVLLDEDIIKLLNKKFKETFKELITYVTLYKVLAREIAEEYALLFNCLDYNIEDVLFDISKKYTFSPEDISYLNILKEKGVLNCDIKIFEKSNNENLLAV